MSADGHDFPLPETAAQPAFAGLQGVDDLIASRGLAILKEHIDGAELRAMLQIAKLVAQHDAAQSGVK